LAPALRDATVRWVILDPVHLSAPAFEEAVSIIAAAGVRVAIYTSPSGLGIARILDCQQRLLPEVILRDTDDDWVRVRDIVKGDEETVAAHLLAAIAPLTSRFEHEVRGATLGLFAARPVPEDVGALARIARVSENTLRTRYVVAGLATPHDLLDVARLSRAFYDLRDGRSVDAVADRYGLGSRRTVERRLAALGAATPAEIRGSPATAFVAALRRSVTRRP
ncbi:MAG: hypothetical protein U9Q74_05365, partial [Gemmatimonadota bacterium]|nr:hypothetical protein [Gemmatimonadota bacterium]